MDGDTLAGICVGVGLGGPILLFGYILCDELIAKRALKKRAPSLNATLGPKVYENLMGIEKAVGRRDYAAAKGLFQERQAILGEIGERVEQLWYMEEFAGPEISEAICKGNKLEEHLYVLKTVGI